MATNFWELLQQHQGDLTKSGRTVAEYLLQHAGEAQYLSISSLAKECCVAEATVFRFCRALGFEGYHEMRIALAQANATGALVNQRVPEPDADTATLCEHASALLMTTINGTQNALSPEAVDRASELLRKARQVYCLGQGGSMLIANDICARFACISTKFRTAGDSHLQLVTASLMTPEDVVLFVSYSGATRDMLETLRTAKAAGAKIILLTHYEDSPGAKLADVVLLCGAQESPLDSGNIPIKVALLYVTGPHQRSAGGEDAVRERPAYPQLSRKKQMIRTGHSIKEIRFGSFWFIECRWWGSNPHGIATNRF